MKYLLAATFLFLITLGLSVQSLSSEAPAACTATANTQDCAAENKIDHNDHTAVMNSLFPEKQKITKLSTRPTMVDLTSPKFLALVTGAAKLEWKEVKGANAYHLQVATDPNFKWLVLNEYAVKSTSYEVAKTEIGLKYYWRVAAVNTSNESMFTKSNFTSSAFISK